MPRVVVRIDYNTPGLTAGQIAAEATWTARRCDRAVADAPGVDPATLTFPAGLTTLVGPEHSGTFFWYNLPVAPGAINDLDRDHSAMCNLTQGWAGHPQGLGAGLGQGLCGVVLPVLTGPVHAWTVPGIRLRHA